MAERRRPAKGDAWDSLAHRKADALVDLAANYADVQGSNRPIVEVVEIVDPTQAPGASVNGEPIATETLSHVKLSATVRGCEVDDTGCARTVRKPRKALSADVERHVRRRDAARPRVRSVNRPPDPPHRTDLRLRRHPARPQARVRLSRPPSTPRTPWTLAPRRRCPRPGRPHPQAHRPALPRRACTLNGE